MGFSILLLIFAVAGLAVYALSNYTSKIGALVTTGTAGVTGLYTDIQTSFSSLVWDPAVNGNSYAIFALVGIGLLMAVMLINLTLTNFRSAVR